MTTQVPNFPRSSIGRKKPAVLLQDNLKTVMQKVQFLATDEDEDAIHRIDMSTLDRLSPMLISRSAMDATLFHFRDSAKLCSMRPYNGELSLVKVGVWILLVTDWLVFWLQAKGVLRLDKIDLIIAESTMPELKEELPVESLVRLSLFNGSPIDQKRAMQWDLRGSVLKPNKVELWNDSYGCLDRALNMNTENLQTRVHVENIAAISELIVPPPTGFVSDRTKNIRVRYSISHFHPDDELPLEHFQATVNYIFAHCPKLEKLTIEMEFYEIVSESFIESVIEWANEKWKNLSFETRGCMLFATVSVWI